jgi:hypothetical protein
MTRSQLRWICFGLVIVCWYLQTSTLRANPYVAKAGESPVMVRAAACAISGGFIHLYSALDYGLFTNTALK